MSDEVQGSRVRRLARLGWLSRRAVPLAIRRMREVGEARADQRAATVARALDKHADIAEEAFEALGDLKGIALKVGQMLSYMDGALPEDYRPVYQRVLARLQHSAPSMPWSVVEPVLVADLGGPVSARFAEFDPQPFAAASIGQVHRARLLGGEPVAVKVQYPGIERAFESDLRNANLLLAVVRPMVSAMSSRGNRGYARAVLAELRGRLLEELDYEREARMQRRFAEMLRGDPVVRVPPVHLEVCGRRVLTTGFIEGRTFAEVCEHSDQSSRDGYGTALARALSHCLYRHQVFNADPHPGNYLFPSDGSVVLLDFGCVKEIPDWMSADMKRYVKTAIIATRTDHAEDWQRFDEAIIAALRLDPKQPVVYRVYREFLLYCLRPILYDRPFEFTTGYTRESIDRVLKAKMELVFGEGKLPRLPKLPPMPVDYTFLNRLQWGFFSVLTALRARVNWYRELPPELQV